MWQALLTLFLLYHELFSDHELFTNRELRDTCTIKYFSACGELRLLFFYYTLNSFPTVNSLPTVNSVTNALQKSSPGYLMQLCCCTLCDAPTACGELCSLFFYCTVNSFPTVNSLPTVNSVVHPLQLCPMQRTHYLW